MEENNYFIRENKILVGFVLACDLIVYNLLFLAFYYYLPDKVTYSFFLYQSMMLSSVVYLCCSISHGVILYKRKVTDGQIVMRVIENVSKYAFVSTLLIYTGNFYHFGIAATIVNWILMVVVISIIRICIRHIVCYYRSSGKYITKVVFLGSYENNIALYKEMVETPTLGFQVVGYFDDEPNPRMPAGCKYLGTPSEAIEYMKQHSDIHELYCCLPSRRSNEILPVIKFCVNNLVHFYSIPNVTNYLHHKVYLHMLGTIPYLSLYREPLSLVENRVLKRAFDIVFSLVFLCTLFPIIFVVVAIITKLTMPGPIFFKQKRTGYNGKEFYCLKFRSMKVNAQSDQLQATKDDPRKTKWGNIMRKTNIDELPQFINVLKGEMSIVGPRPHMLKHTEQYSHLIGNYMVRHYVKPGVTGWSQVTGFRGETKELSQMEGRIKGDIYYIEHWSMWLDFYIIYKTVANAIKGDDEAY